MRPRERGINQRPEPEASQAFDVKQTACEGKRMKKDGGEEMRGPLPNSEKNSKEA